MLKHVIVILFGVFMTNTLIAQSYNIKDESQRVNNKNYTGVSSLVAGDFDNCQAMIKEAFADEDLKKVRPLSSANSINIARLLPQSLYYFFA